MPKMKTKSGAAKRFRVRGSGIDQALPGGQAPHPHQAHHQEQAPACAAATSVHATNLRHVKAMLPYA